MKNTARPSTIFVQAEMERAHTRRILEGVVRYVGEQGLGWRLRWGGQFPDEATLSRQGIDGAIRFHYEPPLDSFGLKTVWVCSAQLASGGAQVIPDNRMIGEKAAAHFRERLYASFAYVGLAGRFLSRERLEGYRNGLGGADVRVWELDPSLSPAPGKRCRRALTGFLRSLPHRTAVFIANDQTAHWVGTVCDEEGLRVPEGLALLGVDDDLVFAYAAPVSLSSIHPASEEVGRLAAARLERMLGGVRDDGEIELVPPGDVALRASSDSLATDDASVTEAVRLMRQGACRGLDVAGLCRRLGLGRRSFEQRFVRVLGRTPEAEMRRLRLERAADLLVTTRLSVARVAEEAGFSDAFYFSAAFRKAKGMSPREWRAAAVIRGG